ncbi:hypothetical protein PC9H_002244 [Pleurotus ostreatus]|uniref:DUF6533 domain-containing protein n=1 Tax=Pleurotus ostreatus TaxID=5322 RepID=A0A8H6ZKI7_PLEOS|nr:uncharacterized protein PC9H_002244 [Pleurotus ostreatus]KAF7419652.1 hypothetical protein PC9H_002244 [Pleurotus ostreatus]
MDETSGLIIDLAKDQRLEAYLVLSSAVILVYDYIITFDLEVSLIWFCHSGWSWTSALFMLNRYLPFVDTVNGLWHDFVPDITHDACRLSFQATGWLYVVGISITEIILTIRTWAIWYRDPKLAVVLLVFIAVVWGPTFAVMIAFTKSFEFGPAPFPGFVGCNLVAANQILLVSWVLLIVYEAGILILMTYRGYVGWRSGGGNTALFTAIYRDGLLYYLYLFVLSLVNIIVIKVFPKYIILLAALERVVHSVLASRVILHIRDLATRNPSSSGELSNIEVSSTEVRLHPIRFRRFSHTMSESTRESYNPNVE